MRIVCLCIIGLLACLDVWGQIPTYEYEMETRLYLRDGRVIRGQLQGSFEADTLELFMAGGSFLRIPRSRLDSVRQGPGRYRRFFREKIISNRRPIRYPIRGMYHRVDFSLLFYRDNTVIWWGQTQGSVNLQYRTGIRLHPNLNLGGGVGIQSFFQGPILPVFAEISGEIRPGRNALVYEVQGGYGWALPSDWFFNVWEGGARGKVALGIHRHMRGKVTWRFTVGYMVQQFTTGIPCGNCTPDDQVVQQGWNNGFTYGIGIELGGKE